MQSRRNGGVSDVSALHAKLALSTPSVFIINIAVGTK